MKHRRISRIATLSLASAAVMAPTAIAQQNQVPRDLRYSMPTSSLAGSSERIDHRTPDAQDAAAGRGAWKVPAVTVVKVQQPTQASTGLDWGDAGIGAGATLAIVLMGVAGSLTVIHRRRGGPRRGPATIG